MSLTFVLGLPGSGKTTFCLDAICNANSAKMLYIVPEQSTLQAERMLVTKSKKAVLGTQAISFGRLAYHVFARCGGAPVKQLNDTGKHMLLRKILKECDLSFYARSAKLPGFIDSLSHTIAEFAHYGIIPHDLEIREGEKLKDLATIYRSYRENIAGRYLVTGETLDLLADALTGSDYLQGGLFWIDGFKDFTPQELNVISKIMATAQNVTVTLTMDKIPTGNLRQSDFFYASNNTYHKLREMADNLAIPIDPPVFLGDLHRYKSPALKHLAKLFPYPNPVDDHHGIKIISAQNKVAELTQAAKWIAQENQQNRMKFRDIALLCGDLPGYEKLARNIFETYGIPLFVDNKTGLLSHPLTELIRAAIDIFVWDWQYEDVFRLLKTGFIPIIQEDIDKIENYVLARGIKGWKWRTSWQDEEMESLRLQIQEMMPQNIASEATIRDFAMSIYSWLYSLDAPGTLTRLLEECTDNEESRWHKQIWPRISEVFDKMVEILGDDVVTISTFSEILDAGLKSTDMGLIPPSLDQVVMGDITRSRYPEVRALWVLGANEGQLPMPISGSGLITEDERATLHKSGLVIAPELPRQMSDNLMALYSALCQPKVSLTLSYSRATSEGKLLRPSPVLARLKRIFKGLEDSAPKTPAGDAPPITEQKAPCISLALARETYGDTFYTAASRLEAFARCPFSYFMRYNLQARERAIYQVRTLDLGILYHDVLAMATGELTQKDAWHSAHYDDLEKMVHSYAEAVIPGGDDHILRSSARNMYILQRVKSICTVSLWALCEQYRRGTFRNVGIEKSTEEIVIPLKENNMIVTGRIDRIDTLGDYVKIIDYKSGNTRFSLEEVQNGLQLQLLLYMNTLIASGKSTPGGVFYFNISDPILSVNEEPDAATKEAMLLKEFRMSGLVLADHENIVGMDKHLQNHHLQNKESLIIPVSIKKDGDFGKNSSVVSAKEFINLCHAVVDQVKEIGQQMTDGIITPKSVENPHCKYCPYGAACGLR